MSKNATKSSASHRNAIQGIELNCFAFIKIRESKYIRIGFMLQPFTFEHRKGIFIQKYETLFERGCIKYEQVFGVMDLKHLCRFVSNEINTEAKRNDCSYLNIKINGNVD